MQRLTFEKIRRLLSDMKPTIHRGEFRIPLWKYHEGDVYGAEQPTYDDSAWSTLAVGDWWGHRDEMVWFRTHLSIPEAWRNHKLMLYVIANGTQDFPQAESLCYANGEPLQALDVQHHKVWLPPEVVWADTVVIALKAWSGMLKPGERCRFLLSTLLWIDEPTEKFHAMASVLHGAVDELPDTDWRRHKLLEVLDNALRYVNFLDLGSDAYYDSVAEARRYLETALAELRGQEPGKPTVLAVGHAHIDLAWLWPVAQTREKAARTFVTQLHLMRQYPEHRFMHSSPQLYKWLKHDYPDIYNDVKAKIKEGTWEATGGMWIEPDTNVPNGESLIRQIMYGQEFLREEFGVETTVLWLPDVFGYSWTLPQVMKKSGLKYFMTTKLSWNQSNHIPYDTFRWRGLDGSEVLVQFSTAPGNKNNRSGFQTYNAILQPWDAKGTWDVYQQKALNNEVLMSFGYGDGGGGPTVEMLESARVLQDLPGFPHVKLGKVEDYFARLEERTKDKRLPVWDGELYFELHRGTYTSQAANKRNNRKAEVIYHDAEVLGSLALLLTKSAYPEYLRQGWELLLFNQFHDILPGSSIREVYEDSDHDYATIMQIGQLAVENSLKAITRELILDAESVVVFNTAGVDRGGVITLPYSDSLADKTIVRGQYRSSVQVTEEDGKRVVLLESGYMPSCGYMVYRLTAATEEDRVSPLHVSPTEIETPWHTIKLNKFGQITSIVWPAQSQLNKQDVLTGIGNVLQVFEDRPSTVWDAWDIDPFVFDKMQEVTDLVEAVVEESGPVRGTLRLKWRFQKSTITQRLRVYQNTSRIDFETEVDWRESHVLLKAAFPVNVRATTASYDIQFGSIQRSTHSNTSWDSAQFEVPAQKWVSLSMGNFGVGLLNDSKYGYDVKENVLRISLLKSATWPDPRADIGQHKFTYSLFPYGGDWEALDSNILVKEGYKINFPLYAALCPPNAAGTLPSLWSVDGVAANSVVIETVKRAEHDANAWIVRVYESNGTRHLSAAIVFGDDESGEASLYHIRRAVECNLVEVGEQPVFTDANRLLFPIEPYEIKTFKVWFEEKRK